MVMVMVRLCGTVAQWHSGTAQRTGLSSVKLVRVLGLRGSRARVIAMGRTDRGRGVK